MYKDMMYVMKPKLNVMLVNESGRERAEISRRIKLQRSSEIEEGIYCYGQWLYWAEMKG